MHHVLSCIWKWSRLFRNLENTLKESNFLWCFCGSFCLFGWIFVCFIFQKMQTFLEQAARRVCKEKNFVSFNWLIWRRQARFQEHKLHLNLKKTPVNIKLGQVSVNSNKQLYNPGKSLFMRKIYQKSSNFMMTPGFSCLGINSKNLCGGSVLSLRLSFRSLSVFYHIFPVVWLQPDSFHKEYDSLHNLWHALGCALDSFSCLGRGTGWMWRCIGSLGCCFCVTVWFCFMSVYVRKGLYILEFVPSLSLSLHINLSYKRYHVPLQDLPFLYPWALADAAGTAGICWICSSCGPHLFVFFYKVPGI